MSATNRCPDCQESLTLCECDTVTVSVPFCPKCSNETSVYCMECSFDFVGCDCVDEGSSWYCMACDWDFEFDIYDLSETTTTQKGVWQDPKDLCWYYDDNTEVKCRCYTPKMLLCRACDVSRESVTSRWLPWVDATIELNVNETSLGLTSSSGYTPGYGYASAYGYFSEGKKFSGCSHNMVEVKINDLTIYASSINDQRTDNIPDWGLYADWIWTPWWRNEHIDWDDYRLPTSYETAAEQIVYAYDKAKLGHKVEIGCIGGHGRTGTILACMSVLEGMSPEEAIKHVTSTYCSKAVETWEQEWWLKWFEAHIKGHELPSKPAPKVIVVQKPTIDVSSVDVSGCTIFEHHTMIREGATTCKWSTCLSFEFDLHSYLRGKKSYDTVSDIADAVLLKNGFQNRK